MGTHKPNITFSKRFETELKKLCKKFISIFQDIDILIEDIEKNGVIGNHLGGGVYKVRLKNSDINKGKSGGYRVIILKIDNNNMRFLTIYQKTERETISNPEIIDIINEKFGNG